MKKEITLTKKQTDSINDFIKAINNFMDELKKAIIKLCEIIKKFIEDVEKENFKMKNMPTGKRPKPTPAPPNKTYTG